MVSSRAPLSSALMAAMALLCALVLPGRPAHAIVPAAAAASARIVGPGSPLAWMSGFSLQLVPGVGTHGFGPAQVRGLSLAPLGALNESVRGLELSLGSLTFGDVRGVQLAQTVNLVMGTTWGLQMAGAANLTADMHGWQLAGGFNWSGDLYGTQAAGGVNLADRVRGWQLAGGANLADDLDGVQLAGGANLAGDVRGVQVAGGVNIARDVRGWQVAPVNVARRLSGVQLGVVNVVGDLQGGDAIGLLTFARGGYNHLQATGFAGARIEGGLTFGGRHLYTVLRASAERMDDTGEEPVGRASIGWGWHQPLFAGLYADVDASVGAIWVDRPTRREPCRCGGTRQVAGGESLKGTAELRAVVGWALFRHLAVFGGVTLEQRFGEPGQGDVLQRGAERVDRTSDGWLITSHPQFVLGLRI